MKKKKTKKKPSNWTHTCHISCNVYGFLSSTQVLLMRFLGMGLEAWKSNFCMERFEPGCFDGKQVSENVTVLKVNFNLR
jgi:hypothetical protein